MSSSVLKKLIQPHSQAVAAALAKTGMGTEPTDMLETLSIVVEQCPVAIAMFDRDMRYLLANRQWVQEFNLASAMPLVGKSQYEVFPKLHAGWREIYERALKGYAMRCEHPVQAAGGGAVISVRSEVRPWRQRRDASVGGVVVMCHKMGGQPEAPAKIAGEGAEAPVAVAESPPEVSAKNGWSWPELPLPIYVVNAAGRIEQANERALEQSLARGVRLGETCFWEVLGAGGKDVGLEQQFSEKLARFEAEPGLVSQVLTLRDAGGGEGAGDGFCRWLLTKMGEVSDRFALMGLMGMPAEENLAVSAAPQAKVSAQAMILTEAKSDLVTSEVKRLDRELFMAREAVARLEQKVRTMRQAEQVLLRREKQQHSVLDALPGGVLVLNELGTPILQNGHLQRLFGRAIKEDERVEDWLGQACPDPQHREEVQRVWRQDVWRRQLTRTLSLVTTDGLLKEIELRPASLAENGLVVHFQDVTQQCRIEEQLYATEGKFRTLFHDNPVPIVLTDKTGAIYDVNLAAEQLLENSKQDLRRLAVDELLTAASVGARRDALREMRQSGTHQQRLTVTLAGDDAPKLHLTLVAIQLGDGEIHSLLHFFETPVSWPIAAPAVAEVGQDETRLEGALVGEISPEVPPEPEGGEVEASAEVTLEPMLLIATNVNGRIVRWTEEAALRFGFAEEEAEQQPLHLLFQPSDASGFYAQTLRQAAASDEAVEWAYFGRDGKRGKVSCEVRAGDQGGAQVEIWLPARVSAAPAESVDFQALRLRADWGLADLSREQVIVSETYHRINHHLSILSSLLNVQANVVTDATAREALRASQNRLRAMAALHAHLEQAGKAQGSGLTGFVEGLVEHLRASYAVPATRVGVKVNIPEQATLPKEWMMPLTMGLNEALSNAFEHAFPAERQGEIRVAMGFEGERGWLSVADDGVGLSDPVAVLAEQGMGLKILALFAEQMRGKLEVVNETGKGTEVKMQFFIAFTDN
jgi:two-component sensor histidine kinase